MEEERRKRYVGTFSEAITNPAIGVTEEDEAAAAGERRSGGLVADLRVGGGDGDGLGAA